MKSLSRALLIFICSAALAGGVELTKGDDGRYQYTEVFDAPGGADELYDRIMTWVALRYNSANDVVQLSDKDNHKIIVKGIWRQKALGGLAVYLIHHTLEIDTKDQRYRLRYGQFKVENASGKSGLFTFEEKMAGAGSIRKKTGDTIAAVNADLARSVRQDPQDDDW